MSYSFSVRAANAAEAKAKVAAQFDTITAQQACHQADRDQAVAAAGAFIDCVAADPSKDLLVHVNGYLSGTWSGAGLTTISQASFSVTASLVAKE